MTADELLGALVQFQAVPHLTGAVPHYALTRHILVASVRGDVSLQDMTPLELVLTAEAQGFEHAQTLACGK